MIPLAWSVLPHPEREIVSNWSSIQVFGETEQFLLSLCLEKVESSYEIEGLTLQTPYLLEGVPDDMP